MDALIPILCFALAVYSVIANDSIQTLGTWMASNRNIKWYWLAIFASVILTGTILYSWGVNAGDISYGNHDPLAETVVESLFPFNQSGLFQHYGLNLFL